MQKSIQKTKPFKSYQELLNLLEMRGMYIEDHERAKRKLEQIGYYRLSGFWYPCRKFSEVQSEKRLDDFSVGTSFHEVFSLYLFDKRLRLLLLDALERVEIYVRAIVAHELSKTDPLAYKNPRKFINPNFIDSQKIGKNWDALEKEIKKHIERSKEDFVLHHLQKKLEIPFWAVVETWDFGLLSKYYGVLKERYAIEVCKRISPELHPRVLKNWLYNLNIIRNRCAHHSRIWNRSTNTSLLQIDNDYFRAADFLPHSPTRLCGIITVLWFLVRNIGRNSKWLELVAKEVENMPKPPFCSQTAMGFPEDYADFFKRLQKTFC